MSVKNVCKKINCLNMLQEKKNKKKLSDVFQLSKIVIINFPRQSLKRFTFRVKSSDLKITIINFFETPCLSSRYTCPLIYI